ncbi:hypothetical protein [Erwinia pyrifoliae]|uniref:Uncharacterized protein n=1 Tax=Erwinia pyrifoliae TaxID=79967 RepID=A0ABY5XED1_ERWPY|nr:hypothetical protein [Erwinia pyrifoliae]AUX72546.1 hypothetical protein CPI84_08690 [Erwinia pyrifoliae]MCA8877200.1 hypothetical protein [Erwinia pyrifoliae]UWS30884.1 hypothetical protein NYP81_05340 [Erwinia pyrifoliae]UWS35318.1 hypothetical protein NYP84_09340 [Erwinia pyrifoliae]UXK13903.1 hypothetical protein NYP80_08915 [Erwinia pyrifoliae]
MTCVTNSSYTEIFAPPNAYSGLSGGFDEKHISATKGGASSNILQDAEISELLNSQGSRLNGESQINPPSYKKDQADVRENEENDGSYINVLGDPSIFLISTKIVKIINYMRDKLNKLITQSSESSTLAAQRQGLHNIHSAEKNRDGAIFGGVAGVGLGLGGAVASVKGLNAVGRSTNQNLKPAKLKQEALESDRKTFIDILDKKKAAGDPVDPKLMSRMDHHKDLESQIQAHHDKHRKVEINAQKTSLISGPLNQSSHSVTQIITSSYGVDAAGETSNAGLAEADKQINLQTGENHRQIISSNDNALNTMNKTVDDVLRSRNNATDAIVNKIH